MYKYVQLAGKGIFPSDARDEFGDTSGGWGSAIAVDVDSWKLNEDGSYEGIIYAVPDRGCRFAISMPVETRIFR
jgi:hypothetical protein